MTDRNWDYFTKDRHYSDVLKERLAAGVEMDSAKALAGYVEKTCAGDLDVVDFGAGPGHYFPILARTYTKGALVYRGVDIDASNIAYGTEYFRDEPRVSFAVGSVLEPEVSVPSSTNCIVSANTLPHVPSIVPLLELLVARTHVQSFVFRMLIGNECVQIKKHLREHDFDAMFERDFQFNNIYSVEFLRHHLGSAWQLSVEPDIFDPDRLETHRLPAQDVDPFYANRVSRRQGEMVFKGDIYMPWKFVTGRRA